ncbi:MAG: GGDEF domain-containing protein [Ilumatobacteraceae bacterium]
MSEPRSAPRSGDTALDDTMELARRREKNARPDRAARTGALVMGLPFLAAASTLAAFSDRLTGRTWLMAGILAVLYLVASSVDFEVALGSAVPSEQILVGMYLLLPPTIIPLVALSTLVFIRASWMQRPHRFHAFLLRAASCWQTIGPALVMYHFHDGPVRLSNWPIYVAALLSQFAIDTVMANIRGRSLQLNGASILKPLAWTFAIDTVLATVGFSAVLATHGSFAVLPFLAAPIGLIWLLAHDRRQQVEASLSLGQAVLEARDEARLDPLTGVANRRAWEEAVAAAQQELDASWGTRIAVVAIADVDRLKQVNDTLGHSVGDALIAATAAGLLREAPTGATIARLGGDEFGVLWVATREEYEASQFEERLRAVMTRNSTVEQLPVLASIGFATTPPHATVEAAVEHADSELFAQKQQRRSAT